MVVQVPTVRALLDIAVLGEVLHADPHVDDGLPAVLAVQPRLGGRHHTVSHRALRLPTLPKSPEPKCEVVRAGKLIRSLVKCPFITETG